MELRNPNKFSQHFIEEYLSRGFGVLPKREVDIIILHYLIEDGVFEKDESGELDYYEMSSKLKISETKVRNLIKDVQLRYESFTEETFKLRLYQLISKTRFSFDRNQDYIIFSIANPMLKQTFEHWVAKVNGFTDSSFSSKIVKLSNDVFADVLVKLYGDESEGALLELKNKLPEDAPEEMKKASSVKEYFLRFVDKYLESFASRSGELTAETLVKGLPKLFLSIFGLTV